MAITVTLYGGNGQPNTTRRFSQGERIEVRGQVRGVLGVPEPFQHVRVEVRRNDRAENFVEVWTGPLGGFKVPVYLPRADAHLVIRVTTTFAVSGQDVVDIPIAVGNTQPADLPSPPVQAGLDTLIVVGIVIAGGLLAYRLVKR